MTCEGNEKGVQNVKVELEEKVSKPLPLTAKQKCFIEEYMKDFNGKAAMKRAGYSARSNSFPASQLLAKPKVKAAIEARMAERRAAHEQEADRVIVELARIAFSDVRGLMVWGPDGVTLRDSADVPDDAAACVAEVSVQKRGTRLKLHDKVKALELLGKHFGLFTDRLKAEVSGPNGGPIQAQQLVVEFVRAAGGGEESGRPLLGPPAGDRGAFPEP